MFIDFIETTKERAVVSIKVTIKFYIRNIHIRADISLMSNQLFKIFCAKIVKEYIRI